MAGEHIPIPDVPAVSRTVADGVIAVFSYTFPIFAETDLKVYLGEDLQESGYTVAGVGVTAGGDVTFVAPPADGVVVTLVRVLPLERTTDFSQAGNFQAKVINDELDKIVAMLQQVSASVGRSVRISITETAEMILPSVEDRANKLLGFDGAGAPAAATVGNAQTVAPMYFDIDSGQTDYDLTSPDRGDGLPSGAKVSAGDLWVDIDGWDLHAPPASPQFEVIGGDVLRLNIDLSDRNGYEMQVRVVSYAAFFGAVPDGSVNSPEKFADRPVGLGQLAKGSPHFLMGFDDDGLPTEVPRFPIGMPFMSPGYQAQMVPGAIVLAGQSLAVADFPALFNVYGYVHGGSGATFKVPDMQAAAALGAGTGLTGEGYVTGTTRAVGEIGGAEEHTQAPNEIGVHTHVMFKNGWTTDPAEHLSDVISDASNVNNDFSYQLCETGGNWDSQDSGMTSYPYNQVDNAIDTTPEPMNIMGPFRVVGWWAAYTGRGGHDELGNIL